MVILVHHDGRLLLHHRDERPGVLHPGCWAGFGGSVEPGETAVAAATREVFEETGLVVSDPTPLCELTDVEGRGDIITFFYARGSFRPEDVSLGEGQGVALVEVGDLGRLRLAPVVRRAVEQHLLPRLAEFSASQER